MSWRPVLVAGAWLAAFGQFFPCPAAMAAAPSESSDLARVDAERIDRDPAWLALLHYRAQAGDAAESEADRTEYFMAAHGKHSSHAELLAAVRALHVPAQRQAFACRFPARYEWLRERLGHEDADAAIAGCPELDGWLARFPGRRVSINFASSYLESPSSTFGHTFLKVYGQSPDELFSPTINYAARTDAEDGELAFVYKGLFGGFPGVVDELPFYRRLRTYTEIEGRDIHEVELALTPAEVRRLLLHTWEIRDGIFDYYFVHENCAYRTLALLDVARPQAALLRRFSAVTVPVDTIRALRAAGMTGDARVWPSTPKHVRALEAQVARQDAAAARAIALGLAPDDAGGTLPPVRQAGVLQLAYEYASVLIDRDVGERTRRKEILGAITKARLALDAPEVLVARAAPAQPEQAHDGGLLAIGMRRSDGRQAAVLEYAAFQHTLTNPLAGYEPHAEISLLNPELHLRGDGLRVQRIDWLVAQSTIPSSTLLAARAWRLQLSSSRRPFAERTHMATSLTYHLGKAWPLGSALGNDIVLSVLPGASVEAARALPHRAAISGVLRTALTRQGMRWAAQLEAITEKFFAGADLRRHSVRATGELRLARNLSLAFSASRQAAPWRAHKRMHAAQITLNWRQPSLSHPFGREKASYSLTP